MRAPRRSSNRESAERAIVRILPTGTQGSPPEKPGKESQLLHGIREAILGHGERIRRRCAQRIAHFKVVLAASLLPYVSPDRNRVGSCWVVHPFPDFVTHDRNIT